MHNLLTSQLFHCGGFTAPVQKIQYTTFRITPSMRGHNTVPHTPFRWAAAAFSVHITGHRWQRCFRSVFPFRFFSTIFFFRRRSFLAFLVLPLRYLQFSRPHSAPNLPVSLLSMVSSFSSSFSLPSQSNSGFHICPFF